MWSLIVWVVCVVVGKVQVACNMLQVKVGWDATCGLGSQMKEG